MERIYSKVESGKLLHLINRISQVDDERKDLIESSEFIQCSTMRLNRGKTFKPHKHFLRERVENYIPQESWIIIKGSVKCTFYDLDDAILAEPILYPGDASFTLYGGHTYLILEDDTIVYEYKTGPYTGQKNDKIFI